MYNRNSTCTIKMSNQQMNFFFNNGEVGNSSTQPVGFPINKAQDCPVIINKREPSDNSIITLTKEQIELLSLHLTGIGTENVTIANNITTEKPINYDKKSTENPKKPLGIKILSNQIIRRANVGKPVVESATRPRIEYRVLRPEDLQLQVPMTLKRGRPKKGKKHVEEQLLLVEDIKRGLPKIERKEIDEQIIDDVKPGRPKKEKKPIESEEEIEEVNPRKTFRTKSGRMIKPPPRHMPEVSKQQNDSKTNEIDNSQSTDHIEEKIDNFPLPSIHRKRKILSQYRCLTCNKVYLARGRLTKHLKLNPDHIPSTVYKTGDTDKLWNELMNRARKAPKGKQATLFFNEISTLIHKARAIIPKLLKPTESEKFSCDVDATLSTALGVPKGKYILDEKRLLNSKSAYIDISENSIQNGELTVNDSFSDGSQNDESTEPKNYTLQTLMKNCVESTEPKNDTLQTLVKNCIEGTEDCSMEDDNKSKMLENVHIRLVDIRTGIVNTEDCVAIDYSQNIRNHPKTSPFENVSQSANIGIECIKNSDDCVQSFDRNSNKSNVYENVIVQNNGLETCVENTEDCSVQSHDNSLINLLEVTFDSTSTTDEVMNVDQLVHERLKTLTEGELEPPSQNITLDLTLDMFSQPNY